MVTRSDERRVDEQPQSTEETIVETNKQRVHLPKMCPQGRVTSFAWSKNKSLWVLGQTMVSARLKERVMTYRSQRRTHKDTLTEVHLDPCPFPDRRAELCSLGLRKAKRRRF